MISEPAVVPVPAGWKVMLVDDEPAVHQISRLILADLAFEGRPVDLFSAASAAQARELLVRHGDIALVLLDVVMETDDAGFALVQHIRGELHNNDIQIVLRTGQPGMAPEREVIQQYEINGYCLKTDITAQRLHSIVISALRNYRHASQLRLQVDRAGATLAPTPPEASNSAPGLAQELAEALAHGALLMQVQPEVDLASNRVCGVELVPQWKTSVGLLLSSRVCEALPAGALRRQLTLDLLVQACYWARSWQARRGAPVTVSIPLVADSLGDRDTLEAVLAMVRDAGLPPGTLDLLISEASLLGDDADLQGAVLAMRRLGVRFTLVEFGARTISLQRLSQLVPDRLKIHRLFVRGVASAPTQAAMARSLIALAQTLKIVAIADGVSSDSDAQFFKWEGCDLGQGDALAPACAPVDVADFLQNGPRSAH